MAQTGGVDVQLAVTVSGASPDDSSSIRRKQSLLKPRAQPRFATIPGEERSPERTQGAAFKPDNDGTEDEEHYDSLLQEYWPDETPPAADPRRRETLSRTRFVEDAVSLF